MHAPDRPGRPTEAASRKEEALWLLEKLVPGSGVNNVPFAVRVDGSLREDALHAALSLMLRRYAVLRTVFITQDEVHLTKTTLPVDEFGVDVERIDQSGGNIDAVLTRFAGRPFILDGSPLLRAGYMKCLDGDIFCVVVHHLVFDAISSSIFMQAFISLYDAVVGGREPGPAAVGELQPLQEQEPKEASYEFWRDQLRGSEPSAPTLRCGSAEVGRPTLTGGTVNYAVPTQTRDLIRQLQKKLRAPEAAILLAAYHLLLWFHGAKPDLVIGAPLDVRGEKVPTAIGYHVNVVPLRLRAAAGASFREMVRQARDALLGAMTHANVSVDDLSAELPRLGSSWRDTLYRHLFNYVAMPAMPQFTVGGMKADTVVVENGYSKFDLEFFITSLPDQLELRAVYYTAVLGQADVEAMLHRYEALLTAAAADPDLPIAELRAWSAADREVIATANRTQHDLESGGFLEAFWQRVTQDPDSAALVDGNRAATYGELWHSGRAIAGQLVARGVVPGDVVAVGTSRSLEHVTAVLGIWLAGAVYLPLDPAHPAPHLIHQLEDSGTKLVLGGPDPATSIVCAAAAVPLIVLDTARASGETSVNAATLAADACLLYPVDADDAPSGVRIAHSSLTNVLCYLADELPSGPGDATLWIASPASDRSALEFLLPLATGGRVIVASDAASSDGVLLRELVVEHDVRIISADTATWLQTLRQLDGVLSGRRVVCSGRPFAALVHRLAAAGAEVHQVFGSAATAMVSTAGRVAGPGGSSRNIGRPIWNTQAFVVDDQGREMPVGLLGELCIAGEGVSPGYHKAPNLVEQCFGYDAEYGSYHRTGVMARWRRDGSLEWGGRLRRCVSVSGAVVNLDEVESVLLEEAGVDTAAVVVVSQSDGDAVVAAFIEAEDTADLADRLRLRAVTSLPAASVPSRITTTHALPRGVDYEINYAAVSELAAALVAREPARDRSADDLLTGTLLELWGQLLKRDDLTAQSHFFDEGGYSLLAAKLAQDIEELTSVRLELSEIFTHPTPAQLSSRLTALGAAVAAEVTT